MNRMLGKATTAAALLLISTGSARAQEPTNPAAVVLKPHIIMLTPDEMKWEDCPPMIPAGAKCAAIEGDRNAPHVPFTYRLKMLDNYRIAPHFHPAEEYLTVISGTFKMNLGEKFDLKNAKPMTAGSFMVMPKGAPHFAWTRGETILQIHASGRGDSRT